MTNPRAAAETEAEKPPYTSRCDICGWLGPDFYFKRAATIALHDHKRTNHA